MILIVSMGIPAKNVHKKKEGFRLNGAVIQVIDWDKKSIIKEIKYKSPKEHLGEGLSMQFKGAAIQGEKFFVVTNTELIIYNLHDWTIDQVISHPTFNDLHGVLPTKDKLYICNTGLEMIQVLNYQGHIIEEINIASVPTYNRFDKEIDYRTIATTKPHEIHVNHLFLNNGELWATQGNLRSAVNLVNNPKIIDFSNLFLPDEMVLCHDGLVGGNRIYFTTVNAHIIVIDRETFDIVDDIDVNALISSDKAIGWTRGLEVVGDKAFLGVTKMRNTKFKDYAKWFLKYGKQSIPSSILEVDLRKKEILDHYEMENYHGHAIYTILNGDTTG